MAVEASHDDSGASSEDELEWSYCDDVDNYLYDDFCVPDDDPVAVFWVNSHVEDADWDHSGHDPFAAHWEALRHAIIILEQSGSVKCSTTGTAMLLRELLDAFE